MLGGSVLGGSVLRVWRMDMVRVEGVNGAEGAEAPWLLAATTVTVWVMWLARPVTVHDNPLSAAHDLLPGDKLWPGHRHEPLRS